ncbi:uncharacterized protein GGS25DRAFT_523546 [Hypoxylon fragiforme]|uniref:uncharacterized protein n=1 Tax=Hypoxylon fragiforme TaxID=63214 RepID=UPI0020C6320F|nr:uncharacterized protein GGS25DRAFT_523546 [Hypoxylon fragiforme]KAI2605872.1 hypothetical protein GGS25DRAFT_523546 [Hypoxylon fragiforme]
MKSISVTAAVAGALAAIPLAAGTAVEDRTTSVDADVNETEVPKLLSLRTTPTPIPAAWTLTLEPMPTEQVPTLTTYPESARTPEPTFAPEPTSAATAATNTITPAAAAAAANTAREMIATQSTNTLFPFPFFPIYIYEPDSAAARPGGVGVGGGVVRALTNKVARTLGINERVLATGAALGVLAGVMVVLV